MISRKRTSSSLIQGDQQAQQLFTFMKRNTSLSSTIDSSTDQPTYPSLSSSLENTAIKTKKIEPTTKIGKSNARRSQEEKQNYPSNIAIPLQPQKITEQTQEKISLVNNSEEFDVTVPEQRVRIYLNNKLVEPDYWENHLFYQNQDQQDNNQYNNMNIWPIDPDSENINSLDQDTYFYMNRYIQNNSKFKLQQVPQPFPPNTNFGIYQQFQIKILPTNENNSKFKLQQVPQPFPLNTNFGISQQFQIIILPTNENNLQHQISKA